MFPPSRLCAGCAVLDVLRLRRRIVEILGSHEDDRAAVHGAAGGDGRPAVLQQAFGALSRIRRHNHGFRQIGLLSSPPSNTRPQVAEEVTAEDAQTPPATAGMIETDSPSG